MSPAGDLLCAVSRRRVGSSRDRHSQEWRSAGFGPQRSGGRRRVSCTGEDIDIESVDTELSNKLGEELKLEATMDEGIAIPESIKEYLEKGPFRVYLQL
jgi:hypothetical protein